MAVKVDEVGKWRIRINEVGGIWFIGPQGEELYLAPFAPDDEKQSVLDLLPKYVLEYYHENYHNDTTDS